MTYAIGRFIDEMVEQGEAIGIEKGDHLRLIKMIDKKLAKAKSRQEIIDELELDSEGLNILDNLEIYRKRVTERESQFTGV